MPVPPNDPKDAVAHLVGMRQRIERLERALAKAPEAADSWHLVGDPGEPAFQNTWAQYPGGGTIAPGSFKKDELGRVRLRGLVRKGGGAGSWVGFETLFVLPVGYRPTHEEIFIAQSNSLYWQVRVLASGVVQVGDNGGATNPILWASLAGISFEGF